MVIGTINQKRGGGDKYILWGPHKNPLFFAGKRILPTDRN